MPGTRNRSTQPPSSARVRRAAHLERDRAVKARKRAQRERAPIHDAMAHARALMRPEVVLVSGPFRATDKKAQGYGWPVVGATGQLAFYGQSRDRARAAARRLNDEGVPAYERDLSPAVATVEEAMAYVGLERRTGSRDSAPVEEKFRLVRPS
jgi:hypothetical protein